MSLVHRSSWIMITLGFLLVIHAGCGKKHLHVSTASGAPGEGELALETASLDESPTVDASGLSGADLGNADQQPSDLTPLNFTHEVPAPSPVAELPEAVEPIATESAKAEETPLMQGSQPDSVASQPEIQTQSSSSPSSDLFGIPFSPSDSGSSGSDALTDVDTANTPPAPIEDMAPVQEDNAPPLVAFQDPVTSVDAGAAMFDAGREAPLPSEEIPTTITVAKIDPDDAIRDQLDALAEQEQAAQAADLQDVFFAFDSWTLSSEGRQVLDEGAEWLQQDATAKLLIEGHCDSRGTQAYNHVLGKKRASAIRDYLVELGIAADRLSVISYGQDRPFCGDPSEVCYQLNRRGHLVVHHP